jgi:hypothetical protein
MAATESKLPVDELLARERRARPRAGIASVVAALFGLAAWLVPHSVYSGYPRVPLIEALQDAAGERTGQPGLLTPRLLFLHDKATALLGVAILQSVAVLALGYVLVVLFHAANARGSTAPRVSHLLAMFGAVASTVGTLGLQIGVTIKLSDFADSANHSTKAARDALKSDVISGLTAVGQIGILALAAATILIALGAMRVGLLTRFLGVLGIIVGAFMVLFGPAGLGAPPFLVQAMWLLMLAVLFFGRLPSGTPPAWQAGEAIPWPTQQELMEARQRAAAERDAAGGGSGAAEARPVTSKKKRKRRG